MEVLALPVNSKLTRERIKKNHLFGLNLHVYVCVISPPVRHTPSSYKAINGPPQGLLTMGGGG